MRVRMPILMLLLLTACGEQKQVKRENLPTPEGAPAKAQASVIVAPQGPAEGLATKLIDIPSIEYQPLFKSETDTGSVSVASFRLEAHAVTRGQFLAFVTANPKWRKSAASTLFADATYLRSWPSDLSIPAGTEDHAVTEVSWFAARSYARWIGRRLPTVAEWEAVGSASETRIYGREEAQFVQRILDWYARPRSKQTARVGSAFKNVHGVSDMHGLIWEWVEDFNTALVTGESRGDTGLDRNLFCGAGSIASADPTDYAAFMRFAFRSSLRASYAVGNLGFRCATEARNP